MQVRKNVLNLEKTCTGCGTCVAACPRDAVSLKMDIRQGVYTPFIDATLCNSCGYCHKVCPGYYLDFRQFNDDIFGRTPENQLLGNFMQCYVGNASDTAIRFHSSSGGMITALLIYALEEGIIDGALVTRMKRDRPLEPEPFIARTRDELLEASSSKYCPVAANTALREIIHAPDNERYAVVGLPCHLHGVRKLEQKSVKLKGKIVLHIGLICNHAPNATATEAILRKQNVPKNSVQSIRYRTDGWPGEMKIFDATASEIKSLKCWNYIGSSFFTPLRCLMCSDATNELADLSFGDAWLPEYKSDRIGKSIVICRTDYGQKLLERMSLDEIIELKEIDETKIIKSQRVALYAKKISLNNRLQLLSGLGKVTPIIAPTPEGNKGFIHNIFMCISIKIGSNAYGRKLLISLPQMVIEQIDRFQYIGANLWYRKRKK